MSAPKIEIARTKKDGKPAVELIVRNAAFAKSVDLCKICDDLGIVPTIDIANRRSIVCTTPQELDAAREPLKKYFDKTGNWIE